MWELYPQENALRGELTNSETEVDKRLKVANDQLVLKKALNEHGGRVLGKIDTLSRLESELSSVYNESKTKLEQIKAFLTNSTSQPQPQEEEKYIPLQN